MTAYYNENDPRAAAVIREAIRRNLIAPGDVDERSIEDVRPDDLRGYIQCHFFAGFGIWSYALDLAGWPRDRPVWTGSCPCQSFSQAGKGLGFADERHLWPAWQHLVAQCAPAEILGEQVASKDADSWVDLVHADLEGLGYAFGCVPFPSAGIGAPHIRDRNYWVAYADDSRWEGRTLLSECAVERIVGAGGVAGGVADANGWNASSEGLQRSGQQRQQPEDSGVVRLADSDIISGKQRSSINGMRHSGGDAQPRAGLGSGCDPHVELAGPTNGFWRDADWLGCSDGKWRPVEPGTFPLAHGAAARVGRLRGYGNAINAQAAAEFVRAYLETQAVAVAEAA